MVLFVLGVNLVVPQLLAFVLRRAGSRFAGPVAMLTSIGVRVFLVVLCGDWAVRLAGRHDWRALHLALAAVMGLLALASLVLALVMAAAVVHVIRDKEAMTGS